jgi:hypothetical protein
MTLLIPRRLKGHLATFLLKHAVATRARKWRNWRNSKGRGPDEIRVAQHSRSKFGHTYVHRVREIENQSIPVQGEYVLPTGCHNNKKWLNLKQVKIKKKHSNARKVRKAADCLREWKVRPSVTVRLAVWCRLPWMRKNVVLFAGLHSSASVSVSEPRLPASVKWVPIQKKVEVGAGYDTSADYFISITFFCWLVHCTSYELWVECYFNRVLQWWTNNFFYIYYYFLFLFFIFYWQKFYEPELWTIILQGEYVSETFDLWEDNWPRLPEPVLIKDSFSFASVAQLHISTVRVSFQPNRQSTRVLQRPVSKSREKKVKRERVPVGCCLMTVLFD